MARIVEPIRFKRLTEAAIMPVRSTPGAAAYDLFADGHARLNAWHGNAVVGTGIAVQLPPGHVGMVCSRSGLAAKNQTFVLNAPGLIDEDYRGELKVILARLTDNVVWPDLDADIVIEPGMRIAQLMVMPVTHFEWAEVETFDETERGAGGLGSTGI